MVRPAGEDPVSAPVCGLGRPAGACLRKAARDVYPGTAPDRMLSAWKKAPPDAGVLSISGFPDPGIRWRGWNAIQKGDPSEACIRSGVSTGRAVFHPGEWFLPLVQPVRTKEKEAWISRSRKDRSLPEIPRDLPGMIYQKGPVFLLPENDRSKRAPGFQASVSWDAPLL